MKARTKVSISNNAGFVGNKKILYSSIALSICIVFLSVAFGFTDMALRMQEIIDKANASGLQPLPNDNKLLSMQRSMLNVAKMTKEQIELGKILYFDPRLSGDKQHSCNSCHNISLFGVSNINKENNPKQLVVPTIFNVMFNDTLYYQGEISKTDRADKNTTAFGPNYTVARAALKALSADNEMRGDISKIVSSIAKSDEYMSYFKRAYGTKVKITPEIIAESLASFIMTLNTFSRYDDFLAGNIKALSVAEAEGLEVFIDNGCVACHNGINLGGSMQPFEVMRQYRFKSQGGLESDSNNMLKVSTLRNVTVTSPYFHNGAFTRLEDAVKEMGQIQIGITLSSKDIKKIIAFFQSLRGNPSSLELPILPFMGQ